MSVSGRTERAGGWVGLLGRSLIRAVEASGDGLILMGRAWRYATGAWARRSEIWSQMLTCGVYSIPVALLVAGFTGMVLALQTGPTLKDYRQAGSIGALVAVSMCREMAPIWVGVVLAARVGSAMAAELGTMRVSEEIDALEVMSIDPARFLVMPRMLALFLMAPVITVYADVVGILGGAVVAKYQIEVDYQVYFRYVERNLQEKDILGGVLIKGPVFGLIVAMVGCSLGLAVKPSEGAEGVGAATRNTVVTSLILLLMFNYLLSSLIRHM